MPARYRAQEILAYHRRDPEGFSERVEGRSITKGLVWNGAPAVLTLQLDTRRATATLDVDGPAGSGAGAKLVRLARRMLALDQPIEAFARTFRHDPLLGPVLARFRGLRVAVTATPFEALVWAVTGQQISVRAAIALRRRMIAAAGIVHHSGLACHPDAAALAAVAEPQLHAAGYSRTKARTAAHLARSVAGGEIPLDAWTVDLPVERMRATLVAVPGVGPWTVDYTLLRGYGWLDGSLEGDLAVRRALQARLGRDRPVDVAETRNVLARYTPWRALAAAYLWASGSSADQ